MESNLRASLGTLFMPTNRGTVHVCTETSEAEVPIPDLRELMEHLDRPDDLESNPYGRAFDQARAQVMSMERRIAEERRTAPAMLAEILQLRPEQRLKRLGRMEVSYTLAQLALERSAQTVHSDPERARVFAQLGLQIAGWLKEEVYGARRLGDLAAEAWARVGNAERIGGDLRGAQHAFQQSRRWREAGDETSLEVLTAKSLEVSLLRALRDFPGALALSDEVIAEYEAREQPVRAARELIKRAMIFDAMGEDEEALKVLEAAEVRCDGEDLWLTLCVRHNRVVNLARLGRGAEAEKLLRATWGLYEVYPKPGLLARRRWAEGLIHLAERRAGQAGTALREARARFMNGGFAYDVALVSIDLAVALAERLRWDELREVLTGALALLEGQPVHREALAALRMLTEAGERQAFDRAVAAEVFRRMQQLAEFRPVGSRAA